MESESLAYHCSVLQVFSCYLAVKYRGIVLNNRSGCYFYATDILGRVGCDNVGDLAHLVWIPSLVDRSKATCG